MSARWLARAAFGLAGASALVLIGFADLSDLALVAVGAVAACLIAAGGYWFLAHRGVLRWMAFGLVIAVLIAVLVVFALHHLICVAIVSVALLALAAGAARRAPRWRCRRARGWWTWRIWASTTSTTLLPSVCPGQLSTFLMPGRCS